MVLFVKHHFLETDGQIIKQTNREEIEPDRQIDK